MEDEYQDFYTFENSSEIDFDYEFDAVKYFDFTRPETTDEIEESEKWFQCGISYPPSPLVVKLNRGFTKLGKSETSSRKYGHLKTCSISNASDSRGVSEISFTKQGEHNVKCIPKSLSHTFLSRSSRLLKPTASHLAKQNRQLSVPSTKINERITNLGSPLKSPGELVATKRQKLEIGYLRKVAHLKHQVSFSHKSTKRVDNGDAKSYTRPKVTIPKEPNLKTADRAQRHRFKNTAESESSPKSDSCSSVASLQERTNTFYKFNGQSFNKKMSNQILSSKGDIGVSANNKRETNVSKEFKLCVNKKPSQSPPTELFNKMSLNSKDHRSSLHEKKQPFHLEGLKKNVSSPILKENKVPNIATEISKRCCPKQNQFGRERIITDIGNILNNTRSILIY